MAAQRMTTVLTRGVASVVLLAGTMSTSACGENDPPASQATPAPKPDTKPEAKPEAKQPEKKPDEAKPAEVKQDDPWPPPQNPVQPTMELTLGGRTFTLEKVVEDETRFHGLSGRKEIAKDGGMIFLFRRASVMQFVMRDCPIDIDIIFVDSTGRITAMHHMKAEAPRGEGEKENTLPYAGAPAWTATNEKYESRLKKYSSRYDAIIAIELAAGTINIDGKEKDAKPDAIVLKVGQKVEGLDVAALKKLAK